MNLESYSTLFVQAGELGLVAPLAVLTRVLLLRRHHAVYLLAGVLLVKGTTFGLALIAMSIAMAVAGVALAGVALAPIEVVFFAVTLHLLRCLPARRG